MQERKTVGQLMEEMRLKAGAQNYHGHEYISALKMQTMVQRKPTSHLNMTSLP